MVHFQTKISDLGKIGRALECKMWLHFRIFWNIFRSFGMPNLWPFDKVCGHLVYLSRFGMFVPRKIWQPWLVRKSISSLASRGTVVKASAFNEVIGSTS
jgi:hypothetical protein